MVSWVIEEKSLYQKNLTSYARVYEKREKALTYLDKMRQRTDSLKRRMYPKDLLEFDGVLRDFHSKKKGFTDYYSALSERAQSLGISLLGFPHFLSLGDLKAKEATVDFKKADEESQRLMRDLPAGSEAAREISGWTKNAQRVREDSLNPLPFYEALIREAQNRAVDRGTYTHLLGYVEYLKAFTSLEAERLFEESRRLEETIYRRSLEKEDAFYLYRLSGYLDLLGKLFRLEATPDDVSSYKRYQKDARFEIKVCLAFLNRKLYDFKVYRDILPTDHRIDEAARHAERFYMLAGKRDRVFLEKATHYMKERGLKTAALVTGGYHTPGLRRMFRKKGISYATVMPAITEETNLKRYEEILLGQLGDQSQIRGKESISTSRSAAGHIALVPRAERHLEAFVSDFGPGALAAARMVRVDADFLLSAENGFGQAGLADHGVQKPSGVGVDARIDRDEAMSLVDGSGPLLMGADLTFHGEAGVLEKSDKGFLGDDELTQRGGWSAVGESGVHGKLGVFGLSGGIGFGRSIEIEPGSNPAIHAEGLGAETDPARFQGPDFASSLSKRFPFSDEPPPASQPRRLDQALGSGRYNDLFPVGHNNAQVSGTTSYETSLNSNANLPSGNRFVNFKHPSTPALAAARLARPGRVGSGRLPFVTVRSDQETRYFEMCLFYGGLFFKEAMNLRDAGSIGSFNRSLVEAEANYEDALEIQPFNLLALRRLAHIKDLLGKTQEAIQLRQLIGRIAPDDARNQSLLESLKLRTRPAKRTETTVARLASGLFWADLLLIIVRAFGDLQNQNVVTLPVEQRAIVSQAKAVDPALAPFDHVGEMHRIIRGAIVLNFLNDLLLNVRRKSGEVVFSFFGETIRNQRNPSRFSMSSPATEPDFRESSSSAQKRGSEASSLSRMSSSVAWSNTIPSVWPFSLTRRTIPFNLKGSFDKFLEWIRAVFSWASPLMMSDTIVMPPYFSFQRMHNTHSDGRPIDGSIPKNSLSLAAARLATRQERIDALEVMRFEIGVHPAKGWLEGSGEKISLAGAVHGNGIVIGVDELELLNGIRSAATSVKDATVIFNVTEATKDSVLKAAEKADVIAGPREFLTGEVVRQLKEAHPDVLIFFMVDLLKTEGEQKGSQKSFDEIEAEIAGLNREGQTDDVDGVFLKSFITRPKGPGQRVQNIAGGDLNRLADKYPKIFFIPAGGIRQDNFEVIYKGVKKNKKIVLALGIERGEGVTLDQSLKQVSGYGEVLKKIRKPKKQRTRPESPP